MSIEKARAWLKKYDADSRIVEFPVSSATVELAAEAVGCEPARIAKTLSFRTNEGVTVFLDESLRRFETVFPACGSSNSAIELTIPELEKYSGFKAWVDICKGWREE